MNFLLLAELEAWKEAGVFFSHSAFTILGSVVISSKIQEFFISDTPKNAQELIDEIDVEVNKIHRSYLKNERSLKIIEELYKDCKDEVQELLSSLKSKRAYWIFFTIFFCCFVTVIILICTGDDKSWGGWTALLLSPLLLARLWACWFYHSADKKINQIRKKFRDKREKYQQNYAKAEKSLADLLGQFIQREKAGAVQRAEKQ